MSENKQTEYLAQHPQYLEAKAEASKQQSKTISIVRFDTAMSPTLSYFQGDFFMSISYTVDGVEQHKRVALDAIQVAHMVAQGAKALAAHVNYDLSRGVGR